MMNSFREAFKMGDDQFFKSAGVIIKYEGQEILGVVQPYEENQRPVMGGYAKTAQLMVDVLNESVVSLGISSGKRIEIKNAMGDWEIWLIDSVRPNAWTTKFILMPSSGTQGGIAEF